MTKEKIILQFTLEEFLDMFRNVITINDSKYVVHDREVFIALRKKSKIFSDFISNLNIQQLKNEKAEKKNFKLMVKRLTNKDVFINSLLVSVVLKTGIKNRIKIKPVEINGDKKVWTKEALEFVNDAHHNLQFKAKFLGRSSINKNDVCIELPYGIVLHLSPLVLKETTNYTEVKPGCFEKPYEAN